MNYLMYKSYLHLTNVNGQIYLDMSGQPIYMYNIIDDNSLIKQKKKKLNIQIQKRINTLKLRNLIYLYKLYNSYFSKKNKNSLFLLVLVCSNIDLIVYNLLMRTFIFKFLLQNIVFIDDLYCSSEFRVVHSSILNFLYCCGIGRKKHNVFLMYYYHFYYKLLKSHTEKKALITFLRNDFSCFPLISSFFYEGNYIIRITRGQLTSNYVIKCIRLLVVLNRINPYFIKKYLSLLIGEVSVQEKVYYSI